MRVPDLSSTQIQSITGEVARYIGLQREKYRDSGHPLSAKQKTLMQPFFPAIALDSIRLTTLRSGRIEDPPFYSQLKALGIPVGSLPSFAGMSAVTLVDVIVSVGPISGPTLFHELVHVVQYAKLGLNEFSSRYVRGFLHGGAYERIPLEINAYELDAEFTRHPGRHFSVEDRVQHWIDNDRF